MYTPSPFPPSLPKKLNDIEFSKSPFLPRTGGVLGLGQHRAVSHFPRRTEKTGTLEINVISAAGD